MMATTQYYNLWKTVNPNADFSKIENAMRLGISTDWEDYFLKDNAHDSSWMQKYFPTLLTKQIIYFCQPL